MLIMNRSDSERDQKVINRSETEAEAELLKILLQNRFYCVFKNGPLEAVPLDLVGTGYTDEQRPAVLQVDNVTDWHKMRQLGFPEYDSRPSSPARSEAGAPDVAGEHASPRQGGPTLAFAKGTPGREEQDGRSRSRIDHLFSGLTFLIDAQAGTEQDEHESEQTYVNLKK